MTRLHLITCLALLLLLVPAILAMSPSPHISSLSPSSWPTDSEAIITIYGSGFDNVDTVQMSKCNQVLGGSFSVAPWAASTYTYVDSTQIVARFSLYGKPPGDYQVELRAPVPELGLNVKAYANKTFTIYANTGKTPTVTTTVPSGGSTTATTLQTTVTSGEGENSVFFESTPEDAEVWMDGNYIGKTAFTYYTNREGTYDVVLKKKGYEDYEAKVTTLEGKRVRFYGILSELPSDSASPTCSVPPTASRPGAGTTTNPKSSLKVPTPWGPDPTFAEESPVSPVLAPGAILIGLALIVLRRR